MHTLPAMFTCAGAVNTIGTTRTSAMNANRNDDTAADGLNSAHTERFYTITLRDNHALFEINLGNFDFYETPKMLSLIEASLESLKHPRTVIDLKKVAIIDSAGIGSLIAIKNILERNGSELVLLNESEHIMRILEITKMKGFFTVFRSPDEVRGYLDGKK